MATAVEVAEREEHVASTNTSTTTTTTTASTTSTTSASSASSSPAAHTGEGRMAFRLSQAAACLAYREGVFGVEGDEQGQGGEDPVMVLPSQVKQALHGMYAQRLPRYDDATAMIVLLRAERK